MADSSNSQSGSDSFPGISIVPDDIDAAWSEVKPPESEAERSPDSETNPYERATVAPPMPQEEYVAKMMGSAPASTPPHPSSGLPFNQEVPTARMTVQIPTPTYAVPSSVPEDDFEALIIDEGLPPESGGLEASPSDAAGAAAPGSKAASASGVPEKLALGPQRVPVFPPVTSAPSAPPSAEPLPDLTLEAGARTGSPLSLANALQGPPPTRRMDEAEVSAMLLAGSAPSEPATVPDPRATALTLATQVAVTQPSATYEDHSSCDPGAFARPHLESWRAPAVSYEISDADLSPLPGPTTSPAPRPNGDALAGNTMSDGPEASSDEAGVQRGRAPVPSDAPDLPEPLRREGSSSPRLTDPAMGERRRSLPPTPTFGLAQGDAIELVTVRATSSVPPGEAVDMDRARDRFEVGDFSGALALAESLLEAEPENADALLLADHCRDVLKQMTLSRLGGLGRVPRVAMAPEQLRWLSLDHRTGFVLSLVDGKSSIDELLDMSGMRDLDALRILLDLVQQKVIEVPEGAAEPDPADPKDRQ